MTKIIPVVYSCYACSHRGSKTPKINSTSYKITSLMAFSVTAASQWMCDGRYSPGSSPTSARHFLSVPLTSYCISFLRTFILPIISPRIILIVAYVVKDGRGIYQLIIILNVNVIVV